MKDYRIVQLADLPIYRIEWRRERRWPFAGWTKWRPVKVFDGWDHWDIFECGSLDKAREHVAKYRAADNEAMHRAIGCWVEVR